MQSLKSGPLSQSSSLKDLVGRLWRGIDHSEDELFSFAEKDASQVLPKINSLIDSFSQDLDEAKSPSIKILDLPRSAAFSFEAARYWIPPQPQRYSFVSLTKKPQHFIQLLKILHQIQINLIHHSAATKRELYYADPSFFQTQAQVDSLSLELSLLLRIPRSLMSVSGASKGLVYGSLRFLEEGRVIDCGVDSDPENPTLVPRRIETMHIEASRAELILVVEKETVFEKLIHQRLRAHLPELILVTAKGYPDYNTRFFLHKTSRALQLPVFYVGDWDAFGIDILLTYQFGSESCALEARDLVVPHIQWLGPFLEDFSEKGRLALSKRDKDKLEDIRSREFFILKRWEKHIHEESRELIIRGVERVKEQVGKMAESGAKYEVEALALIEPSHLTKHFLPSALSKALSHFKE